MYLRRRPRMQGAKPFRVSGPAREYLEAIKAEMPRHVAQLLDRGGYVVIEKHDEQETVLFYSIKAQCHLIGHLYRAGAMLVDVDSLEHWNRGCTNGQLRDSTSPLFALARERAQHGFASKIDRSTYVSPQLASQFA